MYKENKEIKEEHAFRNPVRRYLEYTKRNSQNESFQIPMAISCKT